MVGPDYSARRGDAPPSGRADRFGVRMGWGIFLACWAAAAAVALALGRDANPDLRNYHYYNPFALLEGRWDLDLAAAGPHTFLHPGLDVPFYLLTRGPLNAWPRVIVTLQAGYAGLLAFLVLAVANRVCHGDWRRATASSALVADFGRTGVATLPEPGATQNDIQIACLVVGALLLLLAPGAPGAGESGRAARRHLLAGAMGGAAVGLKLTAVLYPPALAAAAFLAAPAAPWPDCAPRRCSGWGARWASPRSTGRGDGSCGGGSATRSGRSSTTSSARPGSRRTTCAT